jgi:hypothetical protein
MRDQSYREFIARVPSEAWAGVSAEVIDEDGQDSKIVFSWDEEDPNLKALSELSQEQFDNFILDALERSLPETSDELQNYSKFDNETATESSNRNDGPSGELAGESNS